MAQSFIPDLIKEKFKNRKSPDNFKVGDSVRILKKDIADLRIPEGIITNINGAYILVQLKGSKRKIELYPNEIESLEVYGRRKWGK